MSSNAPWSVKGIDPKAREVAKDLARRSGKTLGEWLNEVIIEGGVPGVESKGAEAPESDADRGPYREVMRDLSRHAARETEGSRQAYRGFAYDEPEAPRASAASEPPRRRPTASVYPEPPRRPRYDDGYGAGAGEDELSRVTRALDRLSSRIEAAENRSTVAITGIDQTVVSVLTRLDEVERVNTSVAARFEGSAEELREGHRNLNERLRAIEEDDQPTRQAEAMRSLEAALGKIAGQLYEGEQRTTAAIGEIRQGVREELTQGEYRTRAAVGELREEISDSEQRTRAAFGVLREELGEREQRLHTNIDSLAESVQRVDESTRQQTTEVRESLQQLSARVERTEQRQTASPLLPPRPQADPAIVVDQVVAKVAQRLEQAESRTSDAVRSLQASFAGLDQRLRAAETAVDPEVERRAEARFEALASDLARSVEQARTEMAQQLSAGAENLSRVVEQARSDVDNKLASTGDGRRFEDLERAVRELTGHVEAAERRSAEAIERMGREMVRVTEAMTTRVATVETDNLQGAERITSAVEKRLGRADQAQAEALDRLGEEMSRISERLAERVDASERRSAEAIEEVGDKVAGVAERLNEKFERTAESLSERIRQGEERSQRLLEETRERLDHRLGQAERGLSDKIEQRIGDTQRVISDAVEHRIMDAQRGLADTVEARVGEVQRGVTTSVEQRVREMERGLASTVDQRVGEAQRGIVNTVEQRVGEVQRGLTNTVEQRLGETQRSLASTVEQRVGEVQRGLASSVEQRLGETQRSLAEVASRVEQVHAAAGERRVDYSATVFTPPPAEFLDEDLDLEPFGTVVPEETAAPAPAYQPEPQPAFEPAPAVQAQPASDDGFRRTPMAPDTFEDAEPLADFGSVEHDAEPAPASEPVAESLSAAVSFDTQAQDDFDADDDFDSADDEEPTLPALVFEDAAPAEPEAAPAPVVAEAAAAAPTVHADLDSYEDPFEAADEFVSRPSSAPVQSEASPLQDLEPLPSPPPVTARAVIEEDLPLDTPAPRTSTRDMLEQARAAAKAAAADPKAKNKAQPLPAVSTGKFGDLGPPPPMAGLKNSGLRGPSIGGLLASLRKGKKDEREGSMRTFALVAGTSFAVGLVGAGYALIPKDDGAKVAPRRPGDAGPLPGDASAQTPIAASLVLGDSPRASQAAAPVTDASAAAYAAAVRLIESGETARGLTELRRTADGGHAPAQFYLAKLYENGEAGLTRDVTEARRWTERAAASGDRKAMHNLALFYFSGDGGAKNMTTAAQWFRRAADQGLVDSQYNLGRLYEEGFGVTTNPAEAYKWYLIAGRAGDTEARTSADRIRRQLTAEAAAAAQRAAAAFRSQSASPAARAQPAGMDASEVVTAQRALSRLGYYRGPSDGVASPALQRAIAAWQREQGITASGTINGDTLARLAAAAG